MTLRLATTEDIPVILEMAKKFADTSPYGKYPQEYSKAEDMVKGLLIDRNKSIVILYEVNGKPEGMIAGVLSEMMFSRENVAQELIWWVNPGHRSRKSLSLKEAYEYWAKRVGAKYISMAEPNDEKVARYYERTGYKVMERNHLKVVA